MKLNLRSVFQFGTTNNENVFASVQNFFPKPVLMFLATVLVILIGQVVTGTKVTKLLNLAYIAIPNRSTGIPTASILTILKSLYLYPTDLWRIVETITAKYGDVVQLNLLGFYNVVFIMNPSMLQKIYTSTKQGHLHKPKLYSTVFFGPLKDVLTTLPPDTWKIHRSAISKVFTYNGLLRQLNIFEEHAKRFVLTLQESNKLTPCLSKPEISFNTQVNALTFEIILHIAAGNEVDTTCEEERTQFHNNFERLEELISYRFQHPVNLFNFVWRLNPLKGERDRRMNKSVKYINKIIAGIRKEYDVNQIDNLKLDDDDIAGKSLIELLIKAEFSDEKIFAEMANFFAAGHDTTSDSFKLSLFCLSKHKEYQDKCRKEIDDMFDQMSVSNTHKVSMEDLNSLTFLDMCIKECLRMYSVIPFIGRELKSPILLDQNTYLPPDTVVLTSPMIIHRNPLLYPEPEKFDPYRFLPENMKKRGMCEYMPFSVGIRNCIGFKSAMIELKVLVAYVLRNFEVRSEMSIDDLEKALHKKVWPFPDLNIKVDSRQ